MTAPRYWRDNPARYNLIGVRCGSCGKPFFPPRSVCPDCHRKSIGKMENVRFKGEGEVYSFSLIHDAPSQFELIKPYVVALIQLDEGVMITSQVIDCDPSELRIGMRVRSTMRKLGEEGPGGVIHYGYKFVPADGY
ncbi:MAG: Zn-ribbon domain-containing OB-fold protein [Methanomassiliicoccales archaeon]